ncbi:MULTISPECIES: YHYH domain-containing protein [Vibrio]|uniref:YHYH domain-containing protein n=1 Tax=Vibrio tasmaniensis TaxID=212663 RepID=A0AB38NX61_9VIBR|nr:MULTISPECIES: YHYH domain-containing protein [Vibrio]TKG37751.1 YHYH domain-containing protein [Vibrio tasmaniensis]TKG43190.1 YHYH domain-containing protein [Vibrio tasmaniensis]TKG43913.1 YHYH domain-containing protein [Vibrio tasmaniensis]TKG47568.1 YHYH domain-containing protein [Vibrio tasmaniensis]TKG53908.1 YHYH domain-containing protein [Vibrio tasmaniensis]
MKHIALALFLALSAFTAYAHSGGTDSYGCHVDSRTGVRHCH